jgi:outer membrane lipoprotein carrier protein
MRRRSVALGLLLLTACADRDEPARQDDAPEIVISEASETVDSTIRSVPQDLATPIGDTPTADGSPPAPTGNDAPATNSSDTAAATPPPPTGSQQPPASEVNQILDQAEQAYTALSSLQADFVQRVDITLLGETRNSRGTLFHRTPDRFLMRFSDPAGDVILVDGRYAWSYYPSEDTIVVMRTPMAEGGQQADLQREFLSDASRRFAATLTGSEQVGGRRTHAVTLIPRERAPYTRVRLWIDAQDYLVRRFEITEQNETVRTIELSNLRPNAPVSDDLFQFRMPPGGQIFEP